MLPRVHARRARNHPQKCLGHLAPRSLQQGRAQARNLNRSWQRQIQPEPVLSYPGSSAFVALRRDQQVWD
jgi:hypothetical protein